MLSIALVLIAIMAIISSTTSRIHPDEFDNIAAGRFYISYWFPPPVADPRTLDSYSYAGMSYLNEWDIVYLFAGKFVWLIQSVVTNEIYAFRLFNVSLFLLLTCYAARRRNEILLFAVLLLSAQLWYVFSYFNADAFPLFVAVLAAYELTSTSSAFNDKTRSVAARYWRLGVFVGLLILSKRTFWMFALFILCYAALVELWYWRNSHWRLTLRQAITLVAISCAIALPRIGYDFYVNGTPVQKTEKILATAERLADNNFKPSQFGRSASSQAIRLRSRGVGFFDMIVRDNWSWPRHSLATSFGVYHYLLIYGPFSLYVLMAASMALLVGISMIALVRKGNGLDRSILALSAAFSVGIVGLSLYHSWVNDFQPQGRYLFAIFPIVGVVLVRSKGYLNLLFVKSLIVASFLLACYSFIFVGLQRIPKDWEAAKPVEFPFLKMERDWKRAL